MIATNREELAQRIYNGEHDRTAELYTLCSGIIAKAAHTFYRSKESRCITAGVTAEDLISEGYFALMDAVQAFSGGQNPKGYKFLAYLRYPLQNRFNALIGCRSKRQAYEPLNNALSLDLPPKGDTEGITLMDTITDEDSRTLYDGIADSLVLSEVFPAVCDVLKDKEQQRTVILKKYRDNKTHRQIAEETGLGVSAVNYYIAAARRELSQSRKLKQIYLDVIGCSWQRGGLGYFRNSHTSSVEWAVMELEKKRRRYEPKVKMTDKEKAWHEKADRIERELKQMLKDR